MNLLVFILTVLVSTPPFVVGIWLEERAYQKTAKN